MLYTSEIPQQHLCPSVSFIFRMEQVHCLLRCLRTLHQHPQGHPLLLLRLSQTLQSTLDLIQLLAQEVQLFPDKLAVLLVLYSEE